MARDAQNQAKQTYQTASGLTGTSQANSGDLYSKLVPQFEREATSPVGFTPNEKSDMRTAAEQSAGGAVGAAADKYNTMAASNRNFGGFAPGLDQAARDAGHTLTDASLGIEGQDAKLKEMQRQAGLAGMGGLQSQQNSDVLSSLGLQDQSTNSLVNAGKSGWFQNMTDFMNAAAGDAKGAAGLGLKIP